MDTIIRKNGNVYLVNGEKGFEIYFNMGKDYDLYENKNEKPKQKKGRMKNEEV